VFAQWKKDLAALAECPNVMVKLGGMAMPLNGFGWEHRDRPATSDEFVDAQSPYYHYAIEIFGPDRCMFESNFPVDKQSLSYRTLWNAFKKIAAAYSDDEKAALFHDTAMRVYRLQ
jgi:predicted TIM-barrel fold metal-dependent hydrolase